MGKKSYAIKIRPMSYQGHWITCPKCDSLIKSGMVNPIEIDGVKYHPQCLTKGLLLTFLMQMQKK